MINNDKGDYLKYDSFSFSFLDFKILRLYLQYTLLLCSTTKDVTVGVRSYFIHNQPERVE